MSYNGPGAKESSYYGVYGDPSEIFRDNTKHNLWGMLHEKPLWVDPRDSFSFGEGEMMSIDATAARDVARRVQ